MKTSSAKGNRWKGCYRHSKTPKEYLDQRLDKSGECWIWTRGVDKNGYGQCQSTRCAMKVGVTRAHQLAWVAENGKIPEGKIICHHCDNPSCCNPDHLYAGTWKSNVRDCVSRGRYRNGSKRLTDWDGIYSYKNTGKTCFEVGEMYGCSFSHVCRVWREHNGSQNTSE